MAVLNKPNMLDTDKDGNDSDGFSVETLDSGSDTDIYEETELEKFSRILCDAQKKALAEEKAKGNKWKTYHGHLQTTVHHWKHHWNDLAAKRYLPVCYKLFSLLYDMI